MKESPAHAFLFSKGVNNSSKLSTYSEKRLSTTSGKRAKTVNQNQEKTCRMVKVVMVILVIFNFGFGHFSHYNNKY